MYKVYNNNQKLILLTFFSIYVCNYYIVFTFARQKSALPSLHPFSCGGAQFLSLSDILDIFDKMQNTNMSITSQNILSKLLTGIS